MEKMTLQEFRDSGALWWVNQQLHLFGVALVMNIDNDGKPTEMYPAKVGFRGFPEASNTNGYRKLTNFLNQNMEKLIKDCEEE